LTLWFLWHAFPFAPRFNLPQLAQIWNPMPWSWVSMMEALLGACVLGAALQLRYLRWIAFAVLPAQLCLLNHTLSYATMSGAVLGFIASARFKGRTVDVVGWALPAWLVIEEFRPFALREPVAFALAPFSTWYESGSGAFYSVLFGKLFLYTATVWCLEKRGLRWWKAAGIPALILAVGEIAQRWIAGRTPESTDVVLVAAGAILLKLAGNERLEGDQLATKGEQGQIESL
jgi:hypothetical protein